MYGNFDLKRGDRDGNITNNQPHTYGGVANAPLPPQPEAETPQVEGGATLAIPQYVQDLQRDLRELGFLIIPGDNQGNIITEAALPNAANTSPNSESTLSTEATTSSGKFGRSTEWAVKEFQIYASMTHVAQLNLDRLHQITGNDTAGEAAWEVAAQGQIDTAVEGSPVDAPMSKYVATLDSVENTARYTGPISGVVNERTRTAIRHWLNNNYRCPVVIEAWNMVTVSGQKVRRTLNKANIWKHNEVNTTAPRVFAVDLTNYYAYPEGKQSNRYQVLGTYLHFLTVWGGPTSTVPTHTWMEAELLPDSLIGITIADLEANPDGAAASTFRVVRAVAEQECMGNYASLNGNDDAIMSLGPCHWTMGLKSTAAPRGFKNGELSAFLAYYLHENEAEYREAFGDFGLYPKAAWTQQHAAPMWDNSQKKYTGWWRKHVEGTEPAQAALNLAQLPEISRAWAETVNYRNWHWFFRFSMAGRTKSGFQRAMWDMVRMRIQDFRNVQIALTGTVTVTQQTGQPAQQIQFTHNTTLGAIFTSEKANAILLRWHVFRPAHVATTTENNSYVAQTIRRVITDNPTLRWDNPVADWTDVQEAKLTEAILTRGNAVPESGNSFTKAAGWPTYTGRNGNGYAINNQLGALRITRNSFTLDTAGF